MSVNEFITVFIQLFITVLWLVVVARVLISWVNPNYSGAVARFLYETTEPLLAPIRRFLPSNGMVDWSPLVLLVILGVLVQLVLFR